MKSKVRSRQVSRRGFLKASVGSTAAAGLCTLAPFSAAAFAPPSADLIPVAPDIEPLVELIATTPGDKIIAVMADQVRRGLSYRRFLAANFIAAIRYNIGTHYVFVAHSLNQVALDVGRDERLLPLFYYVGLLRSQAFGPPPRQIKDQDLPPAREAATLFNESIESGDRGSASRALLALARTEGPRRAFDRLWPYAAQRNHNSGGHTSIAVSNAFRTLETIGWQHAEPVLQFLVGQCGQPPGGSDQHKINAERAKGVNDFPADWSGHRSDRAIVLELLAVFRQGKVEDACRLSYDLLQQGKAQAGAIWDAVFLTTVESMARYRWCGPNNLTGHSVTCTNALHFAFRTVIEPATRLYILLEAVEWSTSFLQRELARGSLRDVSITDISSVDPPRSTPKALEEIFSLLPPRRFFDFSRSPRREQDRAMTLAYALALKEPDHSSFFREARRLLCLKSTREVHDFKYPIAAFEHYQLASPEWKANILAASVHYLHGTTMEDSEVIQQTREELHRP